MLNSQLLRSGLVAILFAVSTAQAQSFSGKNLVSGEQVVLPGKSSKGSVLVFLSARCPCSASHENALKDLHSQFAKQGFAFYGIHSNQDEKPEETLKHFKEANLPFPVIEDEGAKIANHFKALKTPHVFVLKGDQIVFEGGVDDSAVASAARMHYLQDALKSLSSEEPIKMARVRTLGCAIKR